MEEELIPVANISDEHMPLIVFVDDTGGIVSGVTKSWTKGKYGHVCMQIEPGYFVSQEPGGYKKVALTKYINNDTRLKFVKIYLPYEQNQQIIRSVKLHLSGKKYKNRYDFIGVFIGQFLGKFIPFLKNINVPWLKYCVERVVSYYINYIHLEKHMSPKEFNQALKEEPKSYVIARHVPKD